MHRFRLALALFANLLLLIAAPSAMADSPEQWQGLNDKSGDLTFQDIRLPRLQRDFQPVAINTLSTSGGHSALWLRYALTSSDDQQLLRVIAPYLQSLDLYVLQDDQLIAHSHTGSELPLSQRPLPGRDFLLPLPHSTRPLELYLRLSSTYSLNPAILIDSAAQIAANDRRSLLLGSLLGALAALALYNLLRFAYARSRSALWLVASQISTLLCALLLLNITPNWLENLPLSRSHLGNLTALLALISTTGFVHRLFQTIHIKLAAQQVFRLIMWLAGGALVLSPWLSNVQLSLLISVLAAGAWLTIFSGSLHSWRLGYRPARLLCSASLLACLFSALALSGIVGYWLVPAEYHAVSSLLGTLLITALLNMTLSEHLQQHRLKQQTLSRIQAANKAGIQAKAEFLAKVSHEVRTPMNGVLGMTELLLASSLSDKQRDYVQTIHGAGNELLNLLNEILDISRLESGQIELDNVPFNLPELIADCLSIFQPRAEQQHIELISFIQPQVPQVYLGDPARLRQVLLNMLDSAFKHTAEGEILLVAAVEQNGGTSQLRLAVQDSGKALSAAVQNELLNAELQGNDLLAANQPGGRMGLIIGRQLVHLMGGLFGLQSGSSHGNTLWLTLPLSQEQLQQPNLDLHNALQGARLLVVDDNATCRKVLQQQCASWGMFVSTAASGKEALALLRSKANLHDDFDLVLLDHDMPGMSGLQLAAKIKEDSQLNHDIRLIMLTGLNATPNKIDTRNAGVRQILAKPVASYTLKTTLASELAQLGSERSQAPETAHTTQAMPADFRVLVAEDNSISTKVICSMLSKLGLQADTVSNGQQALSAMQAKPYDLVLMDCEMPILDGFSATERLCAWELQNNRPATPVIALTAHILSEHKERARRAGMDGHMAKPVELSQLRNLLQHWLAQKQRREQSQHPA